MFEEEKESVLTREHLEYINHCHEVAGDFLSDAGAGMPGAEVIAGRLNFIVIDTSWMFITQAMEAHAELLTGYKLERDEEHRCSTLTLPNGQQIVQDEVDDPESGAPAAAYFLKDEKSRSCIASILNKETGDLEEILHDKGIRL